MAYRLHVELKTRLAFLCPALPCHLRDERLSARLQGGIWADIRALATAPSRTQGRVGRRLLCPHPWSAPRACYADPTGPHPASQQPAPLSHVGMAPVGSSPVLSPRCSSTRTPQHPWRGHVVLMGNCATSASTGTRSLPSPRRAQGRNASAGSRNWLVPRTAVAQGSSLAVAFLATPRRVAMKVRPTAGSKYNY